MTGAPAATDLETLVADRLGRLTLEQKVRLLTGADFWSLHAEPAIGLRRVVVSDGPAGVRGERWDDRDTSVNVPSPVALAATWDEELAGRIGSLLAAEARRKGVDVLLAPTVNLQRSPYGGRHFECFSEDPLLTSRIGAAYVAGVQSGGVAATVKHLVANDSETERQTVDARVDERALRELYLAPFEALVRGAGAWAVMAAYNRLDGTTMTEHPLIDDVLHEEWGFDGVTMSDWFATRSTVPAANGGLDLAMPGPDSPWGAALVEAVRRGEVPEERIDAKVRRILRLAARVGALDGVAPSVAGPARWTAAVTAAELRRAAARGFVLLRNEDAVLPLDATRLGTVAVIGPNAVVGRPLGGGSALVFPPYTVGPLDGLRAALGPDVELLHAEGVRTNERALPVPVAQLRLPERDEPGVEIRFVGSDGEVLGREHRRSASFTWQGSFGEGLPLDRVAAIEVHGRFRADRDGEHALGCSVLGSAVLTVDDAVVLDRVLTLPEGADPIEGQVRAPQTAAVLPLDAGQEVSFRLRVVPSPELPGAAVELTLDPPRAAPDDELAAAVELAARADVAVVVVGTTEEVESEGFDRTSLALPGRQDELVRRVAEANPHTVVVVNAGAPVLLPWADRVPAVLVSWFPGQEFGNALADVLLGAGEPGGRLPVVWPDAEDGPIPSTRPTDGVLEYAESLHVGQRGWDRSGVAPAFPFGHGLGYTTWEYERFGEPVVTADGVSVAVTVRNAGPRPGREVVQLYASRPDGGVERPVRWLVGFAVVDAGPGESVTTDVVVAARSLQHWDAATRRWTTEAGTFRLSAGRSAAALPLTTEVAVGG